MPPSVTSVMYHYVRPLSGSPYPRIKGLELDDFRQQLDYFNQHYTIIGMSDLIHSIQKASPLPDRALLLTFDDGFIDHYQYVFPELKKRGIPGAFYPIGLCTDEKKVLDVHKIHHILATINNTSTILDFINQEINRNRDHYSLKNTEEYLQRYCKKNAWDTAEIIYIKRMLQHALPATLRQFLIDALFDEYVCHDQDTFANNLYMTVQQLQEMAENNMHIGGHSYTHCWLEEITPAEQKAEIIQCKNFIKNINKDDILSFCYPYGSYNPATIPLLQSAGFQLAFTTHKGVIDFSQHPLLELPRFDTNDLPKGN